MSQYLSSAENSLSFFFYLLFFLFSYLKNYVEKKVQLVQMYRWIHCDFNGQLCIRRSRYCRHPFRYSSVPARCLERKKERGR